MCVCVYVHSVCGMIEYVCICVCVCALWMIECVYVCMCVCVCVMYTYDRYEYYNGYMVFKQYH